MSLHIRSTRVPRCCSRPRTAFGWWCGPGPAASLAIVLCGLASCRDALGGRQSGPFQVAWRTALTPTTHAMFAGNPATDSQRLFVGRGSDVVALDVNTGAIRWKTTLPGAASWGVARILARNGRVFLADDSAYALDATTGARLWATPLDSVASLTAPAVDDRFFYAGDNGKHVYAFDATSGVLQWEVNLGPAWPFGGWVHGLSVAGDTLFVNVTQLLNDTGGFRRSVVVALDRLTGSEYWRYQNADTTSSANAFPAVSDQLVVVSDFDGQSFFALDRSTGALRWQRFVAPEFFGPAAAPIIAGNRVYIAGNDTHAWAVDLSTGAVIWQQFIGSATIQFGSCGDYLVIANLALHAVRLSDGTPVSGPAMRQIALPTSGFATVGTRAFVVDENAVVWAFSCR